MSAEENDDVIAITESEHHSQEPRDYETYIRARLKNTTYCLDYDGYLCKEVPKKGLETKSIPISNFVPIPLSQIVRDNGIVMETYFELEGYVAGGGVLKRVVIQAEKFQSFSWIMPNWGLIPIIEPPRGFNIDLIRHVTQILSKGIPSHIIFTHTGWRHIEGKWVYLSSKGGSENE